MVGAGAAARRPRARDQKVDDRLGEERLLLRLLGARRDVAAAVLDEQREREQHDVRVLAPEVGALGALHEAARHRVPPLGDLGLLREAAQRAEDVHQLLLGAALERLPRLVRVAREADEVLDLLVLQVGERQHRDALDGEEHERLVLVLEQLQQQHVAPLLVEPVGDLDRRLVGARLGGHRAPAVLEVAVLVAPRRHDALGVVHGAARVGDHHAHERAQHREHVRVGDRRHVAHLGPLLVVARRRDRARRDCRVEHHRLARAEGVLRLPRVGARADPAEHRRLDQLEQRVDAREQLRDDAERLGRRALHDVREQLEPRREQHGVGALRQREHRQHHVDDARHREPRGAALDAHLQQHAPRLGRVGAQRVGDADELRDARRLPARPLGAHALLHLVVQLLDDARRDARQHEHRRRLRHVPREPLGDAPHAELPLRRPRAEAQLAVRRGVARLEVLEPLREHPRRLRVVQQPRHAARRQRVGAALLGARELRLEQRELGDEVEQRHRRRRPLVARPADELRAEVAQPEAEERVEVDEAHQHAQQRQPRPLGAVLGEQQRQQHRERLARDERLVLVGGAEHVAQLADGAPREHVARPLVARQRRARREHAQRQLRRREPLRLLGASEDAAAAAAAAAALGALRGAERGARRALVQQQQLLHHLLDDVLRLELDALHRRPLAALVVVVVVAVAVAVAVAALAAAATSVVVAVVGGFVVAVEPARTALGLERALALEAHLHRLLALRAGRLVLRVLVALLAAEQQVEDAALLGRLLLHLLDLLVHRAVRGRHVEQPGEALLHARQHEPDARVGQREALVQQLGVHHQQRRAARPVVLPSREHLVAAAAVGRRRVGRARRRAAPARRLAAQRRLVLEGLAPDALALLFGHHLRFGWGGGGAVRAGVRGGA